MGTALAMTVFGAGERSAAAQSASDTRSATHTLRVRGERLAATGRCEEALRELGQAAIAAPNDAGIALVMGQCLIRLRRYDDAITELERAKSIDPELADVDLSLGMARYHRGDLAGASSALSIARSRGPARAQLDFYEGLLFLQRQQAREAATALERAGRAEPASVEPAASYYAGLAWRDAREIDRARRLLQRVVEGWPATGWAESAKRVLAQLDAETSATAWLRLDAGTEYDTNTVLRGSGVELPADFGTQSDLRLVWSGELGSEFWHAGPWTAGARVTAYGTQQEDLYAYNTHYPGVGAWFDYRVSEADVLRVQGDFAYGWVYNDPFLATWTLTPSFAHDFGRFGSTRLYAELLWNNFIFPETDLVDAAADGRCPAGEFTCGPAGLDEKKARNRDGWSPAIGIDHVLPLGLLQTDLTAGYRFQRPRTRGFEWSGQSHEFRLGTRTTLPFDFRLEITASYAYRPFRDRSSYPSQDQIDAATRAAELASDGFARPVLLSGPRRSDDVGQIDVWLEHALTRWLSASVRYAYVNNHSNTKVFDYERHLVGGYLTLRLHD